MNNRNPFIPNIPTPQGGHWNDPSLSQLFNVNILNPQNSSSNQQSSTQGQGGGGQLLHSTHQGQQLYNVGFLNTGSGSTPSVPVSSSFFSSDAAWAAGAAALNSVSSHSLPPPMNMAQNYSYSQLANSPQVGVNYSALQQHQGQFGSLGPAGVQVMHNIVTNQSPRGGGGVGGAMTLTLDTPHHFVHFPVNLSPPSSAGGGRSRSPAAGGGGGQFSNNSQQRNSSSSSSRSQQSQQQQFSVGERSPCSSPGLPLSLVEGLNTTQQYQMSNMMMNSANYLSSLPFLNLNSRLQSPSSSMSPYSGGSLSPSPGSPPPMQQQQQGQVVEQHHVIQHHGQGGNMRGSSTTTERYNPPPPQSPAPPTGRQRNCPQPSPSPAPPPPLNLNHHQQQQQQFFNSRPHPQGQGQQGQQIHHGAPPPAHMLSRPSPSPGAYVPPPSPSPANNPPPSSQRSPTYHHQLLHPASQQPHPLPSPSRNMPPSRAQSPPPRPPPPPPPVKEKAPRKPRAPRKKKEKEPPMKPIPINLLPPPPPSSQQPHLHPISQGQLQLQGGMMGSHLSMPNLSNTWSHVLDLPPIVGGVGGMRPSFGPPSNFPTMPHPQLHQQNQSSRPTYQTLTNVRTSTSTPISQQSSVIRSTSVIQQQQQGTPTPPTPLTVTASPQRAPQRRTSKGGGANNNTATPTPANNKLSMLDYAMEKAGIPSTIIQIHGQGLGQGQGQGQKTGGGETGTGELYSDTELMRLVAETDPPPGNPGATKVSGDFDLESELNRFYSPPSPKELKPPVTISLTAAPVPPTPNSGTAGSGSKVSTSQTTPSSSSQSKTTPPTPQSKGGGMGKGGGGSGTKTKPRPPSDDDDDCEVILVKLGDKKLSNNRRRPLPPGALKRGGPTPRGGGAGGRGGGGVSSRGGGQRNTLNSSQVQNQLSNRPNIRVRVTSASGRRPLPSPPDHKGNPKGGSTPMVRSAYPNGRVVATAPKTTVPIPPRTTARKSTAPLPPPTRAPPPKQQRPPPRQRQKRSASPELDFGDFEIEPKMTRQAARALLQQQIKQVEKLEATTTPKQLLPPIRMKLNLKEGTAQSMASSKAKAGPKSKTKQSSGGGQKTTPTTTTTSLLPPGDDDLLIVDEFLADSDDSSYDPDGERDEASSDSESEKEGEGDAGSGGSSPIPKRKSPGKAKRLKIEDIYGDEEEEEEGKDKKTSTKSGGGLHSHPAELEAEDVDGVSFSVPFDDDGYDSPPSGGGSFSPPSPPFKNYVGERTGKGGDSHSSHHQLWRPEPESMMRTEPPPPILNALREEESGEESEEEEEEEVEEISMVVGPPKFEAPKPSVVLRGTKEDADMALNTMRLQMAQLTKFKLPFFGTTPAAPTSTPTTTNR